MRQKFNFHQPITPKQKAISQELAFMHLSGLGADVNKESVSEVVRMIYPTFLTEARKILDTSLDKVIESLSQDGAGTRAKKFIDKLGVKDVETLVRLTQKDIQYEWGFGYQTFDAFREALQKNKLSLGMLFQRPLHLAIDADLQS